MLKVCCTQFGVSLSLYSSIHLHQKCAFCSCSQWWERWNGSRKRWLYNSAKYKVAMKMIVYLHGWPPWSMHMASLQQQQIASLALSMYFLCCFNSCVWLEKCWLCFLHHSKYGLCFIWNKCAVTSLHTEAYCSKIFKEIQAFTNYWELLPSTEMLRTSYFLLL